MGARRFLIDLIEEYPSPTTSSTVSADSTTVRRVTAQHYYADRVRTIDQIKRLYAVVMGFAVTNCFGNAYKAWSHASTIGEQAALISQVSAFLTLIVIIYLGSERLLDKRYLDIEERDPPPRILLLFDLVTQGATAAWFVILSDTFATDNGQKIYVFQQHFVGNLIILYMINAVFLLAHIPILWLRRIEKNRFLKEHGRPEKFVLRFDVVYYHAGWIVANVIFALIFRPAVPNPSSLTGLVPLLPWYSSFASKMFETEVGGISVLSISLVVFHVLRFLTDFWQCHKVYYPQEQLPDVDGCFDFGEKALPPAS